MARVQVGCRIRAVPATMPDESSFATRVKVGKLAMRLVGLAVVFILALFVPAGTITWPAGWLFLLLFFSFTIALSLWLARFNPDLLAERLTGIGKPDQKK